METEFSEKTSGNTATPIAIPNALDKKTEAMELRKELRQVEQIPKVVRQLNYQGWLKRKEELHKQIQELEK